MHGKTFSEFPPQASLLVSEKAAKLIQKSGKTFSESAVLYIPKGQCIACFARRRQNGTSDS
jgi:hypothetical protein